MAIHWQFNLSMVQYSLNLLRTCTHSILTTYQWVPLETHIETLTCHLCLLRALVCRTWEHPTERQVPLVVSHLTLASWFHLLKEGQALLSKILLVEPTPLQVLEDPLEATSTRLSCSIQDRWGLCLIIPAT